MGRGVHGVKFAYAMEGEPSSINDAAALGAFCSDKSPSLKGGYLGVVKVTAAHGSVAKFFPSEEGTTPFHALAEIGAVRYLHCVDTQCVAVKSYRAGLKRPGLDLGVGRHCVHLQRGLALHLLQASDSTWDSVPYSVRAWDHALRSHLPPYATQEALTGIGKAMIRIMGVFWEYGLVHCDVKLHNMLLLPSPAARDVDGPAATEVGPVPWATHLRLIDFGSVVTVAHGRLGVFMTGTRPFMPPEVFLGGFAGKVTAVDQRKVDVWAVGVTLLCLFVPLSARAPLHEWQWWPFSFSRSADCSGYAILVDLFKCFGTPLWARGCFPHWPLRRLSARRQLQALVPASVLMMLDRMLDLDPATRVGSVEECLSFGCWTEAERVTVVTHCRQARQEKSRYLEALGLWIAPVLAHEKDTGHAADVFKAIKTIRRAVILWASDVCAFEDLQLAMGLVIMLLDSWLHGWLGGAMRDHLILKCLCGKPSVCRAEEGAHCRPCRSPGGVYVPMGCVPGGLVHVGAGCLPPGNDQVSDYMAYLMVTVACGCIQLATRATFQRCPGRSQCPSLQNVEDMLLMDPAMPSVPALMLACPAHVLLESLSRGLGPTAGCAGAGAGACAGAGAAAGAGAGAGGSEEGGEECVYREFDGGQPLWEGVWAATDPAGSKVAESVIAQFERFSLDHFCWDGGSMQAQYAAFAASYRAP